jgi:hypothetical protein
VVERREKSERRVRGWGGGLKKQMDDLIYFTISCLSSLFPCCKYNKKALKTVGSLIMADKI